MTIKTKALNKVFNEFTQIDKFALVSKKVWDDLPQGEANLSLNGKAVKVRIYDVPCNCSNQMHTHRLIDLRDSWDDLKLTNGQVIEISK
jgi:hypothetical protein